MPDPDDIPYVKVIKNVTNPENIRDIPIVGDLYGTANAVVDFLDYGCYPHWTVWAETLFPALGEAVLQAFLFGWEDIARGYFRPVQTRGIGRQTRVPVRGSKNRAGRRGMPRRPGIPEIGDEIGKRLPGSEMFKGRRVTGTEKWVWVIDGYLQRALWYWLLVDIGENFVINWTTAIMEHEDCKRPDGKVIRATRDGSNTVGLEVWSAITSWDTETDTTEGLWFPSGGNFIVPAGAEAFVTLWGEGGAPPASIHYGSQVWADASNGSGMPDAQSPWPVGDRDNPNEPTTVSRIVGPCTVQLEMKCYGIGHQQIRTASLMVAIYPLAT